MGKPSSNYKNNCTFTLKIYIFMPIYIFITTVNLRTSKGFSLGASLVAQMVKCLPAMQETWVQSLGQEDLLEKEMATHSSILAWKILLTEETGGLQSRGLHRVGHD